MRENYDLPDGRRILISTDRQSAFDQILPYNEAYRSSGDGLLAGVPIMVVMMLLAGRTDIMGSHTVSGRLRWLGWLSTGVMGATVVGMLVIS